MLYHRILKLFGLLRNATELRHLIRVFTDCIGQAVFTNKPTRRIGPHAVWLREMICVIC